MGENKDDTSTMTSATTKLTWEERENQREERERKREEEAKFDREEFYRRAGIQDERSESSAFRDIERLSIYRSEALDMRAYREFSRKMLEREVSALERIADAVDAYVKRDALRFK